MLGHVQVALYKRPLALRMASTMASSLLTSSDSEQCCQVCEPPKVKYYSVDLEHGHCGECCLDPSHFLVFKLFEPNLTLANGKTCPDLGFPTYDSTVTHGAWRASRPTTPLSRT